LIGIGDYFRFIFAFTIGQIKRKTRFYNRREV